MCSSSVKGSACVHSVSPWVVQTCPSLRYPNLEDSEDSELDAELKVMDCQSRLPNNMIEALPKSLEHLQEFCTIVCVLPKLWVLTVPVDILSNYYANKYLKRSPEPES